MLDLILGEKYASDPPPSDNRNARPQVARNGIEGKRIEQLETARSTTVSASLPGFAVPQIRTPEGQPAPQRPSVSVAYYDRTVWSIAANEIEALKIAKQVEWNVQEAARQKKLAAEEAKKRADAEEARQKELVRIKEEAAKLDTSGL